MVRVQAQVGDLRAFVQVFDCLDRVEAQVQPLQVDEGLKSFDLHDDVVVQLQFH